MYIYALFFFLSVLYKNYTIIQANATEWSRVCSVSLSLVFSTSRPHAGRLKDAQPLVEATTNNEKLLQQSTEKR